MTQSADLPCIGWKEWVSLPELGVSRLRAKVDTGAKTSTLHATEVRVLEGRGGAWVEFMVDTGRPEEQPLRARARLVDIRWITASSGHRSRRPVFRTPIVLGPYRWPIELTLADRGMMGYRMLLGREAIRTRFLIDPARTYLFGRPARAKKKTAARKRAR